MRRETVDFGKSSAFAASTKLPVLATRAKMIRSIGSSEGGKAASLCRLWNNETNPGA